MITQEDLYKLIKLNIEKMDVLAELMYQNNYLLNNYFTQLSNEKDERQNKSKRNGE